MAGEIRSYRDLEVWQRAFELSREVYQVTKHFPQDERFGLTSQIRRSAVSVPSNIAEGYGRGSRIEYLRFLKISRGSLCELETQALLADSEGFLRDGHRVFDLAKSTGQMLSALIARIDQKR